MVVGRPVVIVEEVEVVVAVGVARVVVLSVVRPIALSLIISASIRTMEALIAS